jgi:hypothetical protein
MNANEAKIRNVSHDGFWLMVVDKEFFLSFADFPWFRKATLEQLFEIEFSHGQHLYWPKLDIDLDLDRIQHPEKYPLVAKVA